MAPCVVVERLEGKQRWSRATVSKHAGIQARESSRWLFTKKREVNEKMIKPCNSPHTITTARRTDNMICTGAGPMRPVHSQPMLVARDEVTFLPFSRRFWHMIKRISIFTNIYHVTLKCIHQTKRILYSTRPFHTMQQPAPLTTPKWQTAGLWGPCPRTR